MTHEGWNQLRELRFLVECVNTAGYWPMHAFFIMKAVDEPSLIRHLDKTDDSEDAP